MATITGFTAARMLEIENASVVDGAVVANNLILTRKDGSQINAGNVRGATGATGPTGEVSTAAMNTAIAASETAAGRGIVAHDVVSVEQTFALQDNAWVTVTNLSVTFVPVVGRKYEFILASSARVMGASGIPVDFRVLRTGGEEVHRFAVYCAIAGLTAGISGSKIIAAPASWAGSQTFTVGIRPQTNNEVQIKNTDFVSTLSVIDVGD